VTALLIYVFSYVITRPTFKYIVCRIMPILRQFSTIFVQIRGQRNKVKQLHYLVLYAGGTWYVCTVHRGLRLFLALAIKL